MTSTPKIITVFGSSRVSDTDADYQKAEALGRLLAEQHYAVCTGGHKGIMQAVSKGAKEKSGHTIGIISHEFGKKANEWVLDVREEKTWKDRLFSLVQTGDAYIYFDGGTGTWTELFVTWEMMSKKLIPMKPMVIMGSDMKDHTRWMKSAEGFLFHDYLNFAESPEDAICFIREMLES